MDNKNFLRDIGLGETLIKAEENRIKKSNILPFISLKSGKMDEARMAVYVHVRNLANTYGVDEVREALDVIEVDYE